jgi:hypothetical protein
MPPTQVRGCRAARLEQTWTSKANVRARRVFLSASQFDVLAAACKTAGCWLQVCKAAGCRQQGARLQAAKMQAAGCAVQGYMQQVAHCKDAGCREQAAGLQAARLQVVGWRDIAPRIVMFFKFYM